MLIQCIYRRVLVARRSRIALMKVYRLRLVARHGRRLRKRIRQSPLQSGIGLLRRADTRLAFHCVCPMLSQACSATPVPVQWHTLRRQSAGSSFPFPASPMLCRCASRVVGGVSLPEVLHSAHRSPCSSPPFEHSPTSPNHELTTSTLAVISLTIFGSPKISKKRKPKCVAETESAFRFIVTHWRFYRTFRSA